MKRLVLAVLATSATAAARPPANCDDLFTATNNSVFYRSKAVFPAEPKSVFLSFFDRTNPVGAVSVCGFQFKPDPKARILRVTTARFESFARIFQEGYGKSGNIRLEDRYGTDVPSRSVRIVLDPRRSQLDFDPLGDVGTPLTIGVRIDGGALRPLFYKSTISTIQVPKTAKSLELYVKVEDGYEIDWRRAVIDFVHPTITFYETSRFPTK